ncbi:HD-GYP domain-containing protein [Serpentinicella sp. ANB-PHB4]|uniref:HD-GYP domain-containing protein n=1 Tax=Serpentinicella sp. ANB-PHB4 TaxID=3074076 RepID=UPI002860AFA3|nr:HD-GYP domain-containing protein [Serpentinicella sp. ANB-PHB4]MDR5659698.1 HD-GYP domain-containing protein [Serpentinicella sp. ANB-PHB4]
MPKVVFHQLTSGMILKTDLYSENELLLLPKGTVISDHLINFLSKWNIEYFEILNEPQSNIDKRYKKEKRMYDTYKKSTEKVVDFMDEIQSNNTLQLDKINNLIDQMSHFTDIQKTFHIMAQLKNEDLYTYQHSVNVSIYAMFIGKWLSLNNLKLKNLISSALLHDIGKLKISKEIVMKPGKLTVEEFRQIKSHPTLGHDLFKLSDHYQYDIAMGILQHHEKEDGSGYPYSIKGNRIHLFGKIIAVADIYDAMTSKRVYKDKQSPFKTAEQLLSDCFGQLDSKIVTTFIKKMSDFYIGASVLLSNGLIGQIIMNNPQSPTKPLVKVKDEFIDLNKAHSLYVQDILY